MMAILAHLLNPGGALGGRARQALVEGPPFVGLRPMRQDLRQQPFRCCHGEHLQRVPQRLVNALGPVHRPRGRQDMGGIRALSPSSLEQMMRRSDFQDRVQQQHLGRSRDQTRAELAQHRTVEAGVSKRQAEQILPIDPAAHRISRLSVRQLFCELQQGHQGQAPWRLGRLTFGWEKTGKAAVVEDRAELVAQAQQQIAVRKRQPRNMSRLVRYR
jgi:hypothetical protein